MAFSLTNSGTFTEGDLTIGRNGMRLASIPTQKPTSAPVLPIIPANSQLSDGDRPGSATSQGSTSSTADAADGRARSSSAAPDETAPSTSTDEATSGDITFRLADLKVISQLGMGSSGVVNKVQHRTSGDVYALKKIQMDMQEQVRKNILQELRTLHEAKCPNIVQCYGSFYDNGVIYSVLEYMDGGSLAQILKSSKKINEKYLSKIAKQVLKGLAYLHKEHIIHRDIKPSNLLINRAGELKIADFGVSGKLANSVADCASWVGTVTYMSPERIQGLRYTVDCDIWSLGLSLVECAEGRFPYPPASEKGQPCGNFWDLLDYIVEKPPPGLSTDFYSDAFVDFVATCLQKDPKRRATTTELLIHPFITMYDNVADEVLAELVKK